MNDNNTDYMGLERLHDADERAYEELIRLIEATQGQISIKAKSYIEDTYPNLEKFYISMKQVGDFVIQHHSIMKPCLTTQGIQSIQKLSNELFSPFMNNDVHPLLNNDIHAYEIITETGFYYALEQELDITDEIQKRLHLLQMSLLRNGSKTDVMAEISEPYHKSLVSNIVRMNDALLHGLPYEYARENFNYEVSISIENALNEIEQQEPRLRMENMAINPHNISIE